MDAVDAALVGGALTGAGLGAVQWWAAKGALGRPVAWIGASAIGYALGLAAGAALVGYETDLGVDDQFTVFGAGGALLFMLLSGLLVARFTPARAPAA